MKWKELRALGGIVIMIGNAGTASANVSLSGFQCYTLDRERLHISEEDYFHGRGLPPVFASPEPGARKVGVEAGIVYVAWPLIKKNGYTEILRANSELAWIQSDAVRPLRRADGSVGGCTLSKGNGGRIIFTLEPGVGVRR